VGGLARIKCSEVCNMQDLGMRFTDQAKIEKEEAAGDGSYPKRRQYTKPIIYIMWSYFIYS